MGAEFGIAFMDGTGTTFVVSTDGNDRIFKQSILHHADTWFL